MEKLLFINNRGQSVQIGGDWPFILTKIEGLGTPKTIIQSQKSVYQDGKSYIDNTLDTRLISIELEIVTQDIDEMMIKRNELMKVFNPKLGEGKLVYEKGNIKREAKAIAEIPPYFPDAVPFDETMQPCLIQLICHNPFLLDEFETSKEISTWIGGIRFPLKLSTKFATKGEGMINIINDGDVETPLKIEIWGPSTNPRITNRLTNEYIQINRKVLHGERLVITTEFGNKRVELNGENVFNYIDLGSTFFNLQVGDNVLEQTSSNVNDDAKVRISYYNRYLGI